MKLILLGPPGAGKGTLASLIKDYYKIEHISTGAIFREEIKNKTAFGLEIKKTIDSGSLISDDVTIEIVKQKLSRDCKDKGWLLDGFPRTIVQADALSTFIPPHAVINFELSSDEVVKRLSGRRTCPTCGKNYHISFFPPNQNEECDDCKTILTKRVDDNEDAIRHRLALYTEQTEPLINYYTNKKLIISIDASPKPEVVFKDIINKLKHAYPLG